MSGYLCWLLTPRQQYVARGGLSPLIRQDLWALAATAQAAPVFMALDITTFKAAMPSG